MHAFNIWSDISLYIAIFLLIVASLCLSFFTLFVFVFVVFSYCSKKLECSHTREITTNVYCAPHMLYKIYIVIASKQHLIFLKIGLFNRFRDFCNASLTQEIDVINCLRILSHMPFWFFVSVIYDNFGMLNGQIYCV